MESSNLALQRLPASEMYHLSFMHKTTIQFVTSAPSVGFFISMSEDGDVKFWHRLSEEIELVRSINVGTGSFSSYAVSYDGKYLATGTMNGHVHVFDIPNFVLVNSFNVKKSAPIQVAST